MLALNERLDINVGHVDNNVDIHIIANVSMYGTLDIDKLIVFS